MLTPNQKNNNPHQRPPLCTPPTPPARLLAPTCQHLCLDRFISHNRQGLLSRPFSSNKKWGGGLSIGFLPTNPPQIPWAQRTSAEPSKSSELRAPSSEACSSRSPRTPSAARAPAAPSAAPPGPKCQPPRTRRLRGLAAGKKEEEKQRFGEMKLN